MKVCPIDGCLGKHSLKHHQEKIRISKKPNCKNGCLSPQVTARHGLCRKCYGHEVPYVRSHVVKQYGLTLDEYDAMVEAQNGVCAICGQENVLSRHGSRKRLCVDHDHTTGKVRELLCSPCNVAIGYFRDDVELLNRAITYLQMKG